MKFDKDQVNNIVVSEIIKRNITDVHVELKIRDQKEIVRVSQNKFVICELNVQKEDQYSAINFETRNSENFLIDSILPIFLFLLGAIPLLIFMFIEHRKNKAFKNKISSVIEPYFSSTQKSTFPYSLYIIE